MSIPRCAERSIDLLRANASAHGIRAATPSERAIGRHYDGVFGRDAAICALGMAISGDDELLDRACAGLTVLAEHQSPSGQIPKFVLPETAEADFWYVGCPDATAWWLVAVRLVDRHLPGLGLGHALAREVDAALRWLEAQAHPEWNLVQQNEASDWADIMPRSGFVLYTNALWYLVQRLYGFPGAERTRQTAQLLLRPRVGDTDQRRLRLMRLYAEGATTPDPLYLSFVNFSTYGDEVDALGNVLAGLFGLAGPAEADGIVHALLDLEVHRPHPLRVVARPITEADPLWRAYMRRHEQNHPYQYHNGGAWPFAGAFWVMLLVRVGRIGLARQELALVAAANEIGGWAFREWLHGLTGEPWGMAGQSWNAATFLLARAAVEDGLDLFR